MPRGRSWIKNMATTLAWAHVLVPRVETSCLFQQLPWRTHPLKWGQHGGAATRPRWPEEASGAGAKMGKKGEPDLAQGSALGQYMVHVCAVPCAPSQTALTLVSAAEKGAPCSERSLNRRPCSTPAAASLPLTAPCHQERAGLALPHTATAFPPDLPLRATG